MRSRDYHISGLMEQRLSQLKRLWRISAANRIKKESGSTNVFLAYLCQQQELRAFCKKISALNLVSVSLVKV